MGKKETNKDVQDVSADDLEKAVDQIDVPANPAAVLAEPTRDVEFHDVTMVDMNLIDPNEWNPNEMDAKTFNRLVEEIREVGFVEPIQVVAYIAEETGETRYLILGGEHRYRAVQVLGRPTIPAVILKHKKYADKDFQKAMTVRLNALRGRLNKEKMVKLFLEFAEKYPTEKIQDMFAFTHKDEWEKLVGETRKGLKKAGLPPEVMEEYDRNVKEIKTVDDLGRIVQHLFQMYKDTVPYGFMVFTWGKKEHVYVAMSKRTKEAMDRLMKMCKDGQIEINTLLGPAIEAIVEDTPVLPKDGDKEPEAPPPVSGSDF